MLGLMAYTAVMAHVDTFDADHFGGLNANASAAAVVARVAQHKSVRLIHHPADHLFDGSFPFCTEQTFLRSFMCMPQPRKVSSAHLRAKRPKGTSLGNERLVKALGRPRADLHQWFEQLHLQETQGRRRELMNAVARREVVYD
jgi:dTDP-4-dehydrorhamnose reductase